MGLGRRVRPLRSDASLGHGCAIGIYAEAESEKRREGGTSKAIRSAAQIAGRGETLARRHASERARDLNADRAAFEAVLPEGVTLETLLAERESLVSLIEEQP